MAAVVVVVLVLLVVISAIHYFNVRKFCCFAAAEAKKNFKPADIER